MRRLHQFAVGVHLAGLVLFAWAWSVTGSGLFACLAGWSCFYGALSLMALRKTGIRV